MTPQIITLTHLPAILLVVLPEGHKYYRVQNSLKTPGKSTLIHSTEGTAHFNDLPQGNWRIVSTLADLTEEWCKGVVEKHWQGRLYADYTDWSASEKLFGFGTALESFHSAIGAEGLDLSPNTLILEKS